MVELLLPESLLVEFDELSTEVELSLETVQLDASMARFLALLTDAGEEASFQLLPPTATDLLPMSLPENPRLLSLNEPSEFWIEPRRPAMLES